MTEVLWKTIDPLGKDLHTIIPQDERNSWNIKFFLETRRISHLCSPTKNHQMPQAHSNTIHNNVLAIKKSEAQRKIQATSGKRHQKENTQELSDDNLNRSHHHYDPIIERNEAEILRAEFEEAIKNGPSPLETMFITCTLVDDHANILSTSSQNKQHGWLLWWWWCAGGGVMMVKNPASVQCL